MYFIILERIAFEAILDIFYFPFWWYTGGVKHAGLWCFELLKDGNRQLGPGLWLKNIFVPMYGQYDWTGRIISFFMRLAQIIGRGAALLVWLAFCLILFSLWLLWPVFLVWGLWHVKK